MRIDSLKTTVELRDATDHRTLKEYDIPNEESTNTAYVEATPDTSFIVSVHIEKPPVNRPWTGIVVQVWLDGIWVAQQYFPRSDCLDEDGHCRFDIKFANAVRVNGVLSSGMFSFGKLETTEERIGQNGSAKNMSKLGEVTVALWFCEYRKAISPYDSKSRYRECPNESELYNLELVPEKALKGRALSTRAYTRPAECQSFTIDSSLSYKRNQDPDLTFHFWHRSRRDLQTLGLIERTPSPVPSENDVKPDKLLQDITRDELIAETQQIRQVPAGIKVEGATNHPMHGPVHHDLPPNRTLAKQIIEMLALPNLCERLSRKSSEGAHGKEVVDDDEVEIISERPVGKRRKPNPQELQDIVDLT